MSENLRMGFDGTPEEETFQQVDLSKLPQPDPFAGSYEREEIRMGLDGPEPVTIRVIPPFPMLTTAAERAAATVESVDLFVRSLPVNGGQQ